MAQKMIEYLYVLTVFSYLIPAWVIYKSQVIATKLSRLGAPNWLSYVTGLAMILYIGINTAYLTIGELTGNRVSVYYRMVHLILFLLPLAFQQLQLKMARYINWSLFHEQENTRIHIPKHQYKKGA